MAAFICKQLDTIMAARGQNGKSLLKIFLMKDSMCSNKIKEKEKNWLESR